MAPRLINNQAVNQANNELELYLQSYILNNYTEQMYRDQTIGIYDILRNVYHIQHPNLIVQRNDIQTYRGVLLLYTRQIPLFELVAIGI
jgi:hypothetical protein